MSSPLPARFPVRALGAEVRSLEYLPDRSTTDIIERIRSH